MGSVFVGTATSTEWCGYMSGAVQSGYRAVAEILNDLKPLALTDEDRNLVKNAHPTMKGRHLKPKYPSSIFWKFLDIKFILGLTMGLIVMHPRFQMVDTISSWTRKALKYN